MTTARVSTCPGIDELEEAIVAGEFPEPMRRHVQSCPRCREQERTVRENLAFMGRLLDELGTGAAAACAGPEAIPDSLPGYRLDRLVARGGQGAVYEATHLQTKRRAAVKMIEAGPASRRGRRRIEREAEISASLRHPNIVTVFDSAPLPDGRYAIAMEYLDGVTLDEWARRVDASAAPDRPAQRQAVRIKLHAAAAVCDAVQHAHQHGVIHRDLKPANVIVDDLGVPRVLDFGIARRVTPGEDITRAGEFAGTLAYASPEQVSGDPDAVDTRSDVYSLGVILYEMLAGRRPYETERSLTGAVANITRTPPAPLRVVEPGGLPAGDELETILRKALAKDRDERYQTARELRDDLENLLAGRAVEAKRASALYVLRKTAARHRVACAVAAGFLVLLTSFAIAMAWSARRLDHQRDLLARSLSSSTIERARLLGDAEAGARAEELVWPELLRAGGDPADPQLGFDSTPDVTQAAWALYELYGRSPSLNQFTIPPGAVAISFEPGGEAVRLIRDRGQQDLVHLSTGESSVLAPATLESPTLACCLSTPHTFAATVVPGGVELLDLGSGDRRPLTDPLLANLRCAQPSATGRHLATYALDGTLRLWETSPLRPIAMLAEGLPREALGHFAADESFFACGTRAEVTAWSPADGQVVRRYPVPEPLLDQSARSVASFVRISPDRRWLAAGFSTTVLLYRVDVADAEPLSLVGHRGFITWLDFSADASVLLSTGSERNLRTWDPDTGRLLGSFDLGTVPETVPALAADGSLVAVADVRNKLRVWETRPRAWLTRLHEPRQSTLCVRFDPRGETFAASAADGSIHAWRASDSSLLWSVPPSGVARASLAFSPDGRTLAAASEAGRIDLFDTADGSLRPTSIDGPPFISWIGFHPGGRTIAYAAADGTISLADPAAPAEPVRLSGHRGRAVEAAFSPDGSSIASVGYDGQVILWDLVHRTPRLRLSGHGTMVRAVAFSADGSTLATGGDDSTIRLWDARTGEARRVLTDVRQHVFGLAFAPSGNLLFSCCRDPGVQVWDTRTGRELATLSGHDDIVLSLAMSPDGRTLVTAGVDRSVGVWDLAYYQRHVRGNARPWRTPRAP